MFAQGRKTENCFNILTVWPVFSKTLIFKKVLRKAARCNSEHDVKTCQLITLISTNLESWFGLGSSEINFNSPEKKGKV